jgi:hypothetical protein
MPVKLKSADHPLRQMMYTKIHMKWYDDEARKNRPERSKDCYGNMDTNYTL